MQAIRERHTAPAGKAPHSRFMWQATEVKNATEEDFLDAIAEASVTGSVGAVLSYSDASGEYKRIRVTRLARVSS